MYDYDKILFMGQGEHSAAKCYDLLSRLNQAFIDLGGIQQPKHWDHEPTQKELDEERFWQNLIERRLEHLVRDIAMALTGKEIDFK